MSDTTSTTQELMYQNSKSIVGSALGSLIAQKLEENSLGVIVKSPPWFDSTAFIDELESYSEYNIGVAFANIDEIDIGTLQEATTNTSIRITDDLSVPIKWRNGTDSEFEWGEETVPDRTVVLVRGDPPKLGSLHRLSNVPLGELQHEIIERLKTRPEFKGNAVAQEVWDAIDTTIRQERDINSVAEYAAATVNEDQQASLDALGEELPILGLFRDSGLLKPGEAAERLTTNLDLVSRVVHMTNRDKRRIMNSIRKLEGEERASQSAFVERLRRYQRTNDPSLLSELAYSDVKEALETSSQNTNSTSKTYKRRTDDSAVSVELALNGAESDLEEISRQFDDQFEKATEKEENQIEITFSDDSRLELDVNTDLWHFVEHFIDDSTYGGIFYDAQDRQDAFENFNTTRTEPFRLNGEEGKGFERLRGLAERDNTFASTVEALDKYKAKRADLIENLPELFAAPLLHLLEDETLLDATLDYLRAYKEAQEKLDNKYRALHDGSASGAAKLLSQFLLLDTFVIETDQGRELILSPLHPLHLWKYVELAQEITENQDSLEKEAKEFLQESVEEQPHVLNSMTIGGTKLLERKTHLLQSDQVQKLPVYTESNKAEPGTNDYLWEYLLTKLTAAYPPAAEHLKISVVDPIKPPGLLKQIVKLEEKDIIGGATIEFAYINGEEKSILEGASSAQEEDIISLFGPDGNANRFKILSNEYSDYENYSNHLKQSPQHAVIINDRSSYYVEEFERDFDSAIHPLYVPKEFEYDFLEDQINISISTEGYLFSGYQNLVNQLYNQRDNLHDAGVHELQVTKETIDEILEGALWTTISAPSMNSDPFWAENMISRERRGDRDYAIYSTDLDLFTRTLRRILNEYPIAPRDADINKIASRIAGTEQSGLLRLITEETIGGNKSRNSKGILGSMITRQWLDEQFSDPKLIFSIDDPRTRSWLNFGDQRRRADLLVVTPDDDGLNLEIIEVKTHDNPDLAYKLGTEKEGSRTRIEGDAVDQLLETTATIRKLFDEEDDITEPPRREVLREQIYYELIRADIQTDKEEWTDRINRVFRRDAQLSVTPRILSVEITNSDASDTHIKCIDESANKLELHRIPKQTIVRLIVSGVDETKTPIPEMDDESASQEEVEPASANTEAETNVDTESDVTRSDSDTDDLEEVSPDHITDRSFGDPGDYADQVEELKRTLSDIGIEIKDIKHSDVDVGPSLVRYKVLLQSNVPTDKMVRRSDDIAREMALERPPRIHHLPGTRFVAVDVPRKDPEVVNLTEYLGLLPTQDDVTVGELPFIAGVEPDGDVLKADLKEAPHMLVGGTTGSGKTVFLRSLLACLIENQPLDNFRLAVIDPKMTDFVFFDPLPNLETGRVITDSQAAADLVQWIVDDEIKRRTEVLRSSGSVDITDHNQRSDDPMVPLIVVIDEYADLIDDLGSDSDEFETNVRRIAQRARNVGIHLVVATQRPSANIINTDLRSNLDMRAAFRVPTDTDSQIILDENGAEDLAGNGDMLFKQTDTITRLQGTYVNTDYLRDLIEDVS